MTLTKVFEDGVWKIMYNGTHFVISFTTETKAQQFINRWQPILNLGG